VSLAAACVILSISKTLKGFPVYTAIHGEGSWEAKQIAWRGGGALVPHVVRADPTRDSIGGFDLHISEYGIQSDYSDVRTAFDFPEHLTTRATGETFAIKCGVLCNRAFYGFWTDGLPSGLFQRVSRRKMLDSVWLNCDLLRIFSMLGCLIDGYFWVRLAKIGVGQPFERIFHRNWRTRSIQASVAVVLFLLSHCLVEGRCSPLSPISDCYITKK